MSAFRLKFGLGPAGGKCRSAALFLAAVSLASTAAAAPAREGESGPPAVATSAEDITANAAPAPTATPRPTPPPPPAVCEYVQVNLSNIGSGRDKDRSHSAHMLTMASDIAAMFNCLKNWYYAAYNAADDFIGNSFYKDDVIAKQFAQQFLGGDLRPLFDDYHGSKEKHTAEFGYFHGVTLANGAKCTAIKHHHIGFPGANKDLFGTRLPNFSGSDVHCTRGQVWLDKQCKVVKQPKDKICGIADLKWKESSPISLLWTDGFDIEARVSFVKFPLNPTQSSKWYAWKASADAPLLVYDPAHSGRITRASQLFGEWTFGGKRTATLVRQGGAATQTDLPRESLQPWADGYEALGALDADGNGEVSNEELEPLALWFDENQDGISQRGEVKRLSEVGVTALYYHYDYRNEVTGSLHARRGYLRSIDGREQTLPSVDWFGEESDTPHSLSMKYFFGGEMAPHAAGYRGNERTASVSNPEQSAAASYRNQSLPTSGLWQWSYDDPQLSQQLAAMPQGYLLFTRGEKEGEIVGYSLVNTIVKAPNSSAENRIDYFYLSGELNDGASGPELTFEVRMDHSAVSSRASLSPDGKTLHGVSTVQLRAGRGFKTITYRWTAQKI